MKVTSRRLETAGLSSRFDCPIPAGDGAVHLGPIKEPASRQRDTRNKFDQERRSRCTAVVQSIVLEGGVISGFLIGFQRPA